MLILDDCASTFKKYYKKSNVIKKIFYEGRHRYFTTVITTQDDKEIDSELRKNSMISIFTSPQASIANFERTSNNYPKHEKEKSRVCITTIFNQEKNQPRHYRKLVYMRDDPEPFRYTEAELYDDFRMCGDSLWNFNKKIGNKLNAFNKHNPFFEKY